MVTDYAEEKKGSGAAMLVAGPFIGLIYVIGLPFIAIATIVILIGKKTLGGMLSLTTNLVSFGWRPSEAYLGGKNKKDKK
jgi:hypothetical protein